LALVATLAGSGVSSAVQARAERGAKPSTGHALGIGAAFVAGSQREEVFNDLRYGGPMGGGELSYLYRPANGRHELGVWGAGGVVDNQHDRPALLIRSDIRYGYVHLVGNGRIRGYLGGSAGGGPNLQQFQIEDGDHLYWATAYDLSVRGRVEFRLPRLGKSRLAEMLWLDGDLPLLGVGSRSPDEITYNNDKPSAGYLLSKSHENTRFVSLHNYQAFRGRAAWELTLARHVAQSIEYRTAYRHFTFPQPLASWDHAVVYRILVLF
jgi:hypothetical protein